MKVEHVQAVGTAASVEECPAGPMPEIGVSGRSNVGKSSLLNMLLGRKRLARVSGTPGKTQRLQFFCVNHRFHLVDLPGYGYARAPQAAQKRWRRMMQDYLQHRTQLRATLQLVDARHAPSRQDVEMIGWLLDEEIPFCLVPTKMDKLRHGQRQAAVGALLDAVARDRPLPGELAVVPTSSQTGEGRREILAWIDSLLGDTRAGAH